MKDEIEGNKVLAEFMGGKVVNRIFHCEESTKTHNERFLDRYNISHARYNSSWDWLMPVINKIFSMDEYVDYKNQTSSILGQGGIYINPKYIENTWEQVVEFVEWYNENNRI